MPIYLSLSEDVDKFGGLPVYFYKKAQSVVNELYERFHLRDDRFEFADIKMLTANVDPLVISVLRREHVELTTQLDLHTPLPSGGAAEVALRAAAIAALEDIASIAQMKGYDVSPVMLGNYIWACRDSRDSRDGYGLDMPRCFSEKMWRSALDSLGFRSPMGQARVLLVS
eukprot:s1784_g5.t1